MPDLRTVLSTGIESALAAKIVSSFQTIQVAFQLQDYRRVVSEAGTFCEGVLMALWFIYSGKTFPVTGIDFGHECGLLMGSKKLEPDSIRDESIRSYIPRALIMIYTVRSKRQVVHLRGIEPDYLDALLISQSCAWVLSELIGLVSEASDTETMALLQKTGRMQSPVVEWIQDEIVVSKENLSQAQVLLIVITSSGGSLNHTEAINSLRKNYRRISKGSLYAARDEAIDSEWIHRTDSDNLVLRAKGWDEARRIAAESLKKSGHLPAGRGP